MNDWAKIKRDFVVKGMTHKQLAEKYGVTIKQINRHSSSEGWMAERKEAVQKKSKLAVEAGLKDAKLLYDTAHMALLDIQKRLPLANDQNYRGLIGALKDVRDMLGIKNELDVEEQKARIANLRKMAEQDKRDTEITVRIDADLQKYAE